MGTDAVYMVGNGRMGAYLSNGDIRQLFGPPYSSPSVLETVFPGTEGYARTPAKHLPRAGVWRFAFMQNDACRARVTDLALPDEAGILRHIESDVALCLRIRPFMENAGLFSYETLEHTQDGAVKILLKTRRGNAVYNDYPLPFPQFFAVLVTGDARVEHPAAFTHDIYVHGQADVLFVGGPSFPECDAAVGRLAGRRYADMLAAALGSWREVFGQLTPLALPKAFPHKERCEAAIEDTVITLIAQQSAQGGILSGYTGHMAYVRDQYGVFRGMLRLGLTQQARRVLLFYIDVFRASGRILNAQAMGVRGLFHFAENDASEITGYLLWQFFQYADATGDTQLLRENIDLLLWLYDRQAGQLADGMMPFNGDETYIAGGLLPRDVINDGSAEATMLYLLSGQALLAFAKKEGLLAPEKAAQMARELHAVQQGYAEHFMPDGRYVANDPSRAQAGPRPAYRYGVCMNLGGPGCDFFGWTKRVGDGVYLCPRCIAKGAVPPKTTRRYSLPSALLMPAWLGFSLPKGGAAAQYARELLGKIRREGHFYSDEAHRKNVGYDYGLLLYNIVALGLEGADVVCGKLLEQIDAAGAWAEYYVEGRPAGTRCRPWESALNIEAILLYIQSWRG